LRAVAGAMKRMDEACSDCQYYGICSGYFMGEATPEQRNTTERGRVRCGVARPVQEYIEEILLASPVGRTLADTQVGPTSLAGLTDL
jgi:uncharacterized protein